MNTETEEKVRVLYREAFARRRPLVAGFVTIAIAMLLLGLQWPKSYESSTTILVEQQTIMEPLMRGAAASSSAIMDRVQNAREIMFSRAKLMQILEHGGWLEDDPSPVEIEYLMEALKGNTVVTQVGPNLIRITYRGEDPERVYRTTEKFASLFIEEMVGTRSAETNAAFEFIDRQVKQYEQELKRSEERLEALRERNPDAWPGGRAELADQVESLRSRVAALEDELRAAQVAEASLKQQMSGVSASGSEFGGGHPYEDRIAELQQQLDTLLLTYHDTYPDVVILRQQIAELEAAMAEGRNAGGAGSRAGNAMRRSPEYQDLRSRLSATRTNIQALTASLEEARGRLRKAEQRADRLQEVEADLAQVMRDHEVNQAIYEDLIRRRENARVSMDMSREHQGLNIRVYEPAYFAHKPSGPRLLHFVAGGFVLGTIVPMGLLFGLLLVDPRVRTGSAISEGLEIHLIGTVPHLSTPVEARRERRGLVLSVLTVVMTVAAVVAFLVLRAKGVLP